MNQINQSSEQQDRVAKTIEKYTQMLVQNPNAPEIHFNLGNLYAQKEEWKKAIPYYKRSIKLDSKFTNAYRNLAKVYLKIGNEIKAANFWYQAIKLEPNSIKVDQYLGLGNTFKTQKKLNKAADCYLQAIEIQPDLLPAYHSLTQVYNIQGKYRKILQIYRQGIQNNPEDPRFHLALAQALASQKKWQQASKRFHSALNLDSNLAVGYYHWGYVLSQMQKWQKAKACYKKAIELKPEYWEAYYQLGLLFQQLQKWHKSREYLEKVTQLNQTFISGYLQLAVVYQKLEEHKLALECCHQALLLAPESSPLEEQAIATYQKILDSHPKLTAELYCQFGKLLRKKSKFGNAIQAYQKTIDINPNFSLAHISIQYTSIPTEQLSEHIDFYRRLVSKNPKMAIAWGNLGDALTQQDNIQEAISCYRKSSYLKVINAYPKLAETSWKEKKESSPDFLIIGSAKCGTSSLNNYLSYHPKILLPHKKELDFFWRRFDYGIDWYLAHFPTLTDTKEFITGEATPNYIRFYLTAKRIKEYCPDTKLILLLRNPVDRSISWYYHKLNHGQLKEDLTTAISVEMRELKNLTREDIVHSGYRKFDSIMSSIYVYQIQTWLEFFDRKQMLILPSEDLYANPNEIMDRVYDFLELDSHYLQKYPKINGGSYNSANQGIRNILKEYFDPYNRQLEECLGMKFNWG